MARAVPLSPQSLAERLFKSPPAFQNDSFSLRSLKHLLTPGLQVVVWKELKWLQFCEGVRVCWLRALRPDCGLMGTSTSGLVLFPNSVLFVQLSLNIAENSILGVFPCNSVHLY